MNKIKKFERTIGGRWTGIIFHRDHVSDEHMAKHPMRFCEAIKKSSTGPITLTKEILNCPGAMRSFGWTPNGDEKITETMAEKNGMKEEIAKKLVKKIPYFKENISAITIGVYESPDIIISYAQPEAAMRLVYQWQQLHGTDLDTTISSVMSVCGVVAVGVYTANRICLSFGCPESRSHGVIGNDRLIIGLSSHLIDDFFRTG